MGAVALSTAASTDDAPASHTLPSGSTAEARATSSTPESIVFCHSCVPLISIPVRRIFEFTPSVLLTVTIVLPVTTIASALTVAMMLNFFTATDLGAATAGVIPTSKSARKRAKRFIIVRVLQRDEQMLPSHLQLSEKFLLHQRQQVLLLLHL